MQHDRIQLAIIMGSSRQGRFCQTVTDWATELIARDSRFEVDIVDPIELPLSGWSELTESRGAPSLCQRLGRADAFIVVTPEYNHSFPASLKAVIDLAYEGCQAKPVGYISYGGTSGGLRAVEQLRLVFTGLHAVSVRDSVSLVHATRLFRDENSDPEKWAMVHRAMTAMLSRLHWWAAALREAREQNPYPTTVNLGPSLQLPDCAPKLSVLTTLGASD